jgi:hypothetical protein
MTKLLKRKNNETPILVFLFCGFAVTAQNSSSKEFNRISRICKKYHPLVKNANLEINKAII